MPHKICKAACHEVFIAEHGKDSSIRRKLIQSLFSIDCYFKPTAACPPFEPSWFPQPRDILLSLFWNLASPTIATSQLIPRSHLRASHAVPGARQGNGSRPHRWRAFVGRIPGLTCHEGENPLAYILIITSQGNTPKDTKDCSERVCQLCEPTLSHVLFKLSRPVFAQSGHFILPGLSGYFRHFQTHATGVWRVASRSLRSWSSCCKRLSRTSWRSSFASNSVALAELQEV